MTDPTPSAPTAEMLAQEAKRLALIAFESGNDPTLESCYRAIDRLARLARFEPPTEGNIQAVATQRQPIVPEGMVLASARMPRCWGGGAREATRMTACVELAAAIAEMVVQRCSGGVGSRQPAPSIPAERASDRRAGG
jgi:hypothetical protein